MQILYWNRSTATEEVEKVYGDAALKWIYETKTGQELAEQVLSRGFLSKLYGAYQSSGLSKSKVAPFIRQFQIPMDEYEDVPYKTFNDFFIRKFKSGMRPFAQSPRELAAFAEARYLAYEKISVDQTFPVKGSQLSAPVLLGSAEHAKPFVGGPLLLARLCPTDYHRFHFPDAGEVLDSYTIAGKLHSVNPIALQHKGEIFGTNERQISILQTQNFGKLAYIEVGAMMVGKIVQTHLNARGAKFERGEEKGYFLFGGSTVIVLGEPGLWKPDADLLEQTSQQRETLVRLGERVARTNL
jgi:phosphatidylserine decarboxylase